MSNESRINPIRAMAILQDRSASFWLKEAVKRAMERDIVDVQNDVDALNSIFEVQA